MKNNIFNRIFRPKKLREFNNAISFHKTIMGWLPQLEQDLNESNSLEDLMNVHKHAWEIGYRNANLGPCPYGMFRTSDILEMKPEEVYLGGIWGLSTKNIPFWEENKDETMIGNGFGIDDDIKIYDLIMSQYRNHLRSNFVAMKNQSKAWMIKNTKYEM